MPTATEARLDDNWVGKQVRWGSHKELCTVRGVTNNDARVLISNVSSPQRVLSVPAGEIHSLEDTERPNAKTKLNLETLLAQNALYIFTDDEKAQLYAYLMRIEEFINDAWNLLGQDRVDVSVTIEVNLARIEKEPGG